MCLGIEGEKPHARASGKVENFLSEDLREGSWGFSILLRLEKTTVK